MENEKIWLPSELEAGALTSGAVQYTPGEAQDGEESAVRWWLRTPRRRSYTEPVRYVNG